MSINLNKSESINLTKAIDLSKGTTNNFEEVIIGLGWDAATSKVENAPKKKGLFSSLFSSPTPIVSRPPDIDCDASIILCRNGHFISGEDLIYYGHLNHNSGAVHHCGDNLTGDGDGDDEQIIIRLKQLPNDVDRIGVVVNIYSARSRNQHFGMIENAFVRIVNTANNQEICRYNLSENYDGKIAMIFGELYKSNNEWQFKAIGNGTSDGSIQELAARFK